MDKDYWKDRFTCDNQPKPIQRVTRLFNGFYKELLAALPDVHQSYGVMDLLGKVRDQARDAIVFDLGLKELNRACEKQTGDGEEDRAKSDIAYEAAPEGSAR